MSTSHPSAAKAGDAAADPKPRARRTQAERSADTRRRLLESAVTLIAERGLQATTLAEIGERASFSRAIATHHFGDKEGLLRALAAKFRADSQPLLRDGDAVPQEGLERVLWLADAYITLTTERRWGVRAIYFLFAEALMLGGALQAEMTRFNEETLLAFERQLAKGIERAEIRADVEPRIQSIVLLAMLRGMVGQYAYLADALDAATLRDQVLRSIRQMLSATPGGPTRKSRGGRRSDPAR